MIRKRLKAVRATSKIIMLRHCGWWWEDSVENMIRALDSFIKPFIVYVLAVLQMQCVVSASFRPTKDNINSLPVRSFSKSSPSTGCMGEFNNNDSPKIVCIGVSHIPWALNKRRAQKLCEQDLRMFPICCDADRFLENVTPSIFRLSTLARFASIGWTSIWRLRLGSTNIISLDFSQFDDKLLHDVCRATVALLTNVLYCSPPWSDLTSASDRAASTPSWQRPNIYLTVQICSPCSGWRTVQSYHVASLPRAATSTTRPDQYSHHHNLCNRGHQLQLTQNSAHFNNKLFIIRVSFKDSY